MSKEKTIKLQKYADDTKNKLQGAIPEKHKNNPETYKNFLKHELVMVNKSLEEMKDKK